MGTRGLGSIGGLFLGAVAQRVVHLAKVPVLLVKQGRGRAGPQHEEGPLTLTGGGPCEGPRHRV